MIRRVLVGAATALALGSLSACGPTTYDESAATTEAPATAAVAPAGTTSELLELMLAEVAGLGAKVAANSGDGAAADRIEALWAAVADDIEATRPELVEDFLFVVSRAREAADRNRPADADRAYKNLQILVDAYLQ